MLFLLIWFWQLLLLETTVAANTIETPHPEDTHQQLYFDP